MTDHGSAATTDHHSDLTTLDSEEIRMIMNQRVKQAELDLLNARMGLEEAEAVGQSGALEQLREDLTRAQTRRALATARLDAFVRAQQA